MHYDTSDHLQEPKKNGILQTSETTNQQADQSAEKCWIKFT